MPRRVPHRCGTPGCPFVTPCPAHGHQWSGARKAELPDDWAARRQVVLDRDHHICYLCGAHATEVDHVIPGNDHRYENLAAICDPCHRRKSAHEGAMARKLHARGKR